VTWCVLGDEDSKFYHTRASARLRTNRIKIVEEEGIRYFTHKEKEKKFTKFYRELMGQEPASQPLIDLDEVYPVPLNLSSFSRPFMEEVYKALKLIPRDKSPGPDGFGSAFYQDFWNIVKVDIMNLFHQFYNEEVQLDRNNRSYMVLIKKRDNACTPDAYRPISLLNCPVKLVTKVLALRLQDNI
jgi:hypothetical protein